LQRLLHSATLAAATDPRTGRIDMDLINTGRSASSRDRTQQLIKEIKNEKSGALHLALPLRNVRRIKIPFRLVFFFRDRHRAIVG